MPTSANLNFDDQEGSSVNWHSDDEPLFGGGGDSRLIVSFFLGSSSKFRWKAKSCWDTCTSVVLAPASPGRLCALYGPWSGT